MIVIPFRLFSTLARCTAARDRVVGKIRSTFRRPRLNAFCRNMLTSIGSDYAKQFGVAPFSEEVNRHL
jgi:hypothetical protein